MEVHAHSHTARKKWTHYLWEFLMLFLAVFCGFLAEYQLEHIIENQREKKLIQSMIGDLQTDTATCRSYLKSSERSLERFDSLFNMLENYKSGSPAAKIYKNMRSALSKGTFIFATGTLQQLKNAGGFRLIHKQKVIYSIQQYEKICNRILSTDDNLTRMHMDYRDLISKVADARFFKYTSNMYENDSMLLKAPLLPFNKEDFNRLLIKIDFIRNNTSLSINNNLPAVKAGAERLMQFLKKEYHIK